MSEANKDLFSKLDKSYAKHLHGNLYKIRFDKIRTAPDGIYDEDGTFKFGNPRFIQTSDGKIEAKGLDKPRMEELRDSISTEGLENPLRLRLLEENGEVYFQVVNGERRYRSLSKLIKDDADCYVFNNAPQPASKVFEWVDCRVDILSDEEALKYALRPQETGESIGEAAKIFVVKMLRNLNKTDQEIINFTGKSVTWLRETDKLLTLDENTFKSLEREEINRRVALSLSEIEDVSSRLEKLSILKDSASKRIENKKQQLRQELQRHEDDVEIVEATSMLGSYDDESFDSSVDEEKIEKKKQKILDTQNELEKLSQVTPTVNAKDLQSIEETALPISLSKIKKYWYKSLNDEDYECPEDIRVEDMQLVKNIIDAIIEGWYQDDGKTPVSIEEMIYGTYSSRDEDEEEEEVYSNSSLDNQKESEECPETQDLLCSDSSIEELNDNYSSSHENEQYEDVI